MNLVGFGECLPYKENRVTLNKNVADVFGIPVLHFNIAWGENEKKMIRDMAVSAGEMLEASARRTSAPSRSRIASPATASTRWARRGWAAIRRRRC